MRVLVIGGAGFIGRHLVGRLVAQGHVVHVPTRQYKRGRELMVHPTVTVMQADVHDDATLDRLVAGCDLVVNLVGILHSRGGDPFGPDFDRAHVQLPQRIAQACRRTGAARFIHISALGADAPEIVTMLHPSPASPAANRGWDTEARKVLVRVLGRD